MFRHYLITALRNIYKNKTFAFINIIGIAFGLATAMLIFMWVADESSYDSFNTNENNIYRVIYNTKDFSQATMCGALAPAVKKEIPEIDEAVRIWSGWDKQIYYNNQAVEGRGRVTESVFFDIFTFPLLEGNKQTLLDEAHSIVISQSLSRALFGNQSPIGKVVQIKNRHDQKEDFHITGVVKDAPGNSHIQFDFLFSWKLMKEWFNEPWVEGWENTSFCTYLLVNKSASAQSLDSKITQIYNSHVESDVFMTIEPLAEVYQNASMANLLGPSGSGVYVKLFLILGILILFVASINYVNLAIAQSMRRLKEFGLRKVVGANKGELALQNLGESVITAVISLPLAVLLVQLIIPVFNSITEKTLYVDYSNITNIAAAIGLTLVIGLVSGIYPAIFVSSINPINLLRQSRGNFGTIKFFRKALVVFQFSLSIVIIVATIIISQQMGYIQNKQLGYEKENLLYAWVPGTDYQMLKDELLQNPDILNVGASGAQLDWLVVGNQ